MKNNLLLLFIFLFTLNMYAQEYVPKPTHFELRNAESTLFCDTVTEVTFFESAVNPLDVWNLTPVNYVNNPETWHWGFLIMRQDNPLYEPYRYIDDTLYTTNQWSFMLQDTFTNGWFHICAAMFDNNTNDRFTPWLSSSHKFLEKSSIYCDDDFDETIDVVINNSDYVLSNGDSLFDFSISGYSTDSTNCYIFSSFGYSDTLCDINNFNLVINDETYFINSDTILNFNCDTIINNNEYTININGENYIINQDTSLLVDLDTIIYDTLINDEHLITINGEQYIINSDSLLNINFDTLINNEIYTIVINNETYIVENDTILNIDLNQFVPIDTCFLQINECQLRVNPNPNNGNFILDIYSPESKITSCVITLFDINMNIIDVNTINEDFNVREEQYQLNLQDGIYIFEIKYISNGIQNTLYTKLIINN